MGRIVGIDLGTTNTAVAVLQDGRPRVIEDDRGYKVLPSVVSSRGDGRFVVGQAAHNLILTHPDRTVYATKRLIGRRFDSPEVQRARDRLHYQIREAPDGGVQLRLGDEWLTPAEVAAVVLQVAASITEKAIGEPVEEAVITVPAHFNHQQRAQTMEAARLAGLRCDRLLNEPTAAALAYGHRKNIERTIVIFDLGGGTFDVTVLKLESGVYEVLATSGDTYLGGEDFDYRVLDHLADAFQARTGKDIRPDRNALQRVKDAAERAKCDLSFSDRTNIVVPHVLAGENLESVLTRTTLESLTADLVTRCVDITRSAVRDAGINVSEVDEVVLVGGQTRMPRVREAVAGLFGREPSRSVHPEEAVAIGAAVHASSLNDASQPQTILLDVTPFDLGIDSSGGSFSPIVVRNARVPTAESRTFATVHDNQTTVRVTVRQGTSRVASENEFLAEFVLEGLKPAPRMQTKVDVNFRIDSNGILHVTASDRASGEQRQISVRNYGERAKDPRLPTPEEASQEAAARAARASAEEARLAAEKVGAGTVQKAGLLASIFGRGTKAKAAAGVAAAGATAAAAAAAAAPPSAGVPVSLPAPTGPAPTIDLAAVSDPGDELMPLDEDDDAAVLATIAEEEDLYGRQGTASLGLGGTQLPAPESAFGDLEPFAGDPFSHDGPIEDKPLDMADLFSGMDEPDDDPVTEARGRMPQLRGQARPGLAAFPGGPAPMVPGDPFSRDLMADDPPHEAESPPKISLPDVLEPEGEDPFASLFGPPAVSPGSTATPRVAAPQVLDSPTIAPPQLLDGPTIAPPQLLDTPSIAPPQMLDTPTIAAPQMLDTPSIAAPQILPESSDFALDGFDTTPEEGVMTDGGDMGEDPLDSSSFTGGFDVDFNTAPPGTPAPLADLAQDVDIQTVAPSSSVEGFDLEPSTAGSEESFTTFGFTTAPPGAVVPLSDFADGGNPFDESPTSAGLRAEQATSAKGAGASDEPVSFTGSFSLEVALVPDEPAADAPAATKAAAKKASVSSRGAATTGPSSWSATAAPSNASRPGGTRSSAGRAPGTTSSGATSSGGKGTGGSVSRSTSGNAAPQPAPPLVPPAPSVRPPAAAAAAAPPVPDEPAAKKKKPARLKLHYRERESFLREYLENLRRGGAFIKTEKPLAVGRECVFEIDAPGLMEPLVFDAVVTYVTAAGNSKAPGMGVEYRMDGPTRDRVADTLARL